MPEHRPGRALVTGGDGIVGRAVVRRLTESGVAVTALDVAFDEGSVADRVIAGDARDPEALAESLDGVDCVVHLAAIVHRDHGTPVEVYSTNTDATFAVLASAGEAGVARVAIASSIHATGIPLNHHGVMPPSFPIDEDTPLQLDDWYSLSKASDELTLRMACSHWGMSGVALRLPMTGSAATLDAVAESDRADPSARVREGWSYLTLEDAADAFLAALTADISGPHVVGVAAPTTLLAGPTVHYLHQEAPGVSILRPIPETTVAVDVRRSEAILGFTARRAHALPPVGGA